MENNIFTYHENYTFINQNNKRIIISTKLNKSNIDMCIIIVSGSTNPHKVIMNPAGLELNEKIHISQADKGLIKDLKLGREIKITTDKSGKYIEVK